MKEMIVRPGKILIIAFSIAWFNASGQEYIHDGELKKTLYGFSTKAILDIGKGKHTNLRIGIAAGIGYHLYDSSLASLQLEYSWLWRGLGTFNNGLGSYFGISPHITQSFNKSIPDAFARNQPLYYFTDLIPPPLQNPYRNSIGVGMVWIRFFNSWRTLKWQQLAHIGFKFNGAHIVYNNDGGPILKYWGDKEDRYFTGSGYLNVHLDDYLALNRFHLSFYKFTGYEKMAFEVSDELMYSSVDYKNPNVNFFNRGYWSIGFGNTSFGDVFVRLNNPPNIREVQNFIHYTMGFGYHQNIEPPHLTFGGSVNYFQTNIPKK